MRDATSYNRSTYDRIWPQMSDYIRYNPGARHRRRHIFEFLDTLRFSSLLDVGCGLGRQAGALKRTIRRKPGGGGTASGTLVGPRVNHYC